MTSLPLSIDRIPRALPLPPAAAGRRPPPWLVWLVPAVALVIGAWLGVRALLQRGPTVTITFATAEGLEARKTTIKYKSVDIGVIKSIDLLEDRSGVVVTAQLSRQVERLLREDARFWVVRPRVSAAGISGMGTLLTGAHIGFDGGVSEIGRRDFVGLEVPPSTISDRRGRRFTLRADSIGSLDIGSPLYLRRFQVGQVTAVALGERGDGVVLEVFVDAPYDRHVTANSRFWNASGVDVTVSTRGIKLDTQSLASVLVGGIAFETPAAREVVPAAAAGAAFNLFANREAALRTAATGAGSYRLVFDRPVRGLLPGAPVELLGLEMGEVLAVDVDVDVAAAAGTKTAGARTVVAVSLDVDRLRLRSDARSARRGVAPGDAQALLDRMVKRGLRAQVRTENMLTGQRYVAFDFVPGARRARADWTGQPAELPTIPGGAADLQESVTRLVAKLEKVPLDELARQGTAAAREMRHTLEQASRLVNRVDTELAPQMGALMGQAEKTMASVQETLSSDAPLQQELRGTLRDLGAAGHALRSLAEYLERHPESLIRGKKEDRP